MQVSESTLEFRDNPIDDLGMERCLVERDIVLISYIMDMGADEVETILNR